MLALFVLLLCITSSFSASTRGAGAAGPRLNNDQLYKFSYTTEVLVDRAKGSKDGSVGYRISSDVDVNLVWRDPSSKDDQLIQLVISNVKIKSVAQRSAKKNIFEGATTQSLLGENKLAALERPFMVHLKNGKVSSFYCYKAEPASIKNLKRGVASLLQVQSRSGKVIENDVSGRCTVEYKASQGQVIRTKALETCKTAETGFTTYIQVLGVSGESSSVTVFTLEDGFIKSATAKETHILAVNARRTTAAKIVSRQNLTLVTIEAGPFEAAGKNVASVVKSLDEKLYAVGVTAEKVKSQCKGCQSLFEHWQEVQKQFEPDSLSKAIAPRRFLALIQSIRKASKDEILQVLKSSTKTALPQVVDAVTSSQTPASLDAMLQFLNFADPKGLVLQERFLYACGFASHPNERMLQALVDISKGKIVSNDIKESVVIIMGALVHKLCQKGGCELPTVVEVKKMILEGPDSTQVESDVQMYLLALKNSLLPEAIPLFSKYAESEVGAYCTISLTALQRYDVALITDEVKQTVNRVYHQNRRVYEKNVRAAAADVVFSSNPSYMEVKNMLLSIGNLPRELNKYMLSKVNDILHFEMPASKILRQAMKDMISHNYDRFSKVGSSSAFSGFMARTADATTTYSLDILYSGSGVLRRSNMNIYGASNGAMLHGLQVAIEAQGMESLIAAKPDEGEEDLESFAGMSALLFDVQLRPVTFFKGYSDLMSKMFSMSGEPMNVVKGLILLTDHSQVIQLQSGLKANAEFQGGLAIDISGGMEVSLWYRESKTSVNNKGAMVVTGNVTVDMDFVRTGMEVSFETEASLDFITTVQFSEYPFLVCMQMDKTTFPFSESLTKYESLPSGKRYVSRRGHKQLLPGSEFPLHQENSNMCKRVFDSDW
ncbi:microsomal triglyceride transfer protein-like isoform X1 [Oncorhynchus keta]|uniref:microsomal triglyceride transfer protein-like isoform X1 n=2 Tax=Oncorhynchus keta TaxID=8018 RepID=UPI00227A9CC8|nr:microsomal triglyceride transfer protein-like isoform X1 [Oncorhynchus keta]XP_052342533.1 microsomal triglyceride transfer protein-like isoform X1 [Oncorhynchus keta]